ncbi:hypothetical protein AB0875_26620 [Micromonospora gifhornensis]|uniref:hypothetical protein n=1 Tax=Micromonospora gifhornensis TaxID=84594 RepID=UPI00345723C5
MAADSKSRLEDMQRIAALTTDLIPDLRKKVASNLTLALLMMQLHPFIDASEDFIGDHQLLLQGSSRRWRGSYLPQHPTADRPSRPTPIG